MALYRSIMAGAAPGGIPPEAMEAARGTLGGATAVAALPDYVASALLDTARHAFTQSFELMAIICTVLSVAAAAGTAIMLRRASATADPHAQ